MQQAILQTLEDVLQTSKKTHIMDGIRVGHLEARLAQTPEDIRAAQILRYQVFYEEMKAKPSEAVKKAKRDFDHLDDVCDHLLVIDHGAKVGGESPVVGTYRLITKEIARQHGGFYSASEYDISPLLAYPGEILELGRSCVHKDYRTRIILQLLWRSIISYVNFNSIEILFGCASFPGTDPAALKDQLAYLYYHHLAPPAIRPVALPERYISMDNVDVEALDARKALSTLPPLIKGYIRAGAFVGDGAVIDCDFNTTDVCIIVKTELFNDKYTRYYDLEKPTANR